MKTSSPIINNVISFKANPIPKGIINNAKKELLAPNVDTVDIYCHNSADEDAINSAKVFSNWLKSNGKNTNICVPSSETNDLYFDKSKYSIKADFTPADKTVILDFNSKDRMNKLCQKLLENTNAEDIVIFDHHSPEKNTIKSHLYIDEKAKSCCSILVRFFEGLGEKLNKTDAKSLYCGMVSDYKKSGLLKVENKNGKYILHKTDKLKSDKNALEVFEKIDKKLTEEEKAVIYKHLDPLSRLSRDEKLLQKKLYERVQVSPNGKLAYVIIPPNDKLWAKVGMDNVTTSEIMKDLRKNVVEHKFDTPFFNKEQKEKLKNVDTVMIFYRKSKDINDGYCLSMHSASNSAIKLINYAKVQNPDMIGGGHDDRAGGKIVPLTKENAKRFVCALIKSSELL